MDFGGENAQRRVPWQCPSQLHGGGGGVEPPALLHFPALQTNSSEQSFSDLQEAPKRTISAFEFLSWTWYTA